MQQSPLLLCVGYDTRLLDSRSKVLATRYNVEYVALGQEANARPSSSKFDLLVLCHTLTAEYAAEVTDWFHAQWPYASVVRLFTPGREAAALRTDLDVDATEGPGWLLTQIDGLLGMRSAVQVHSPRNPVRSGLSGATKRKAPGVCR